MYYKPRVHESQMFGRAYRCKKHPLFEWCTLFEEDGIGLAVVQQRFDPKTKKSWWSTIDPWLANDIYKTPKFHELFNRVARPKDINGCYPTMFVRQLMRTIGLPPLEKEYWETRF